MEEQGEKRMLLQMVKKLLQECGSVPHMKYPLCSGIFLPDNFFTYNESLIDSYFSRSLVKNKGKTK